MQPKVFILDAERLDRNKVFENSREVRLRLVGRERSNRVISVGYNTIVITVHHNQRDCAVVQGSCCM
jgi:hypothetical protein